ncbi:MAG: RdgB/HAM1 family non-canonical purine NTP pyrophosphatase [Bacteroidota bacterium]
MNNPPLPLLVVATNNTHKLDELRDMLAAHFEVKGMTEVGFTDDIPEDADTFAGNALIKARTIAGKLDCACLADDSGLSCDALNGAPGVYSARYAGEPKDDRANLLKLLNDLEHSADKTARFVTSLAFIRNGLEYVFDGEVQGQIIADPRGTHGFGYDPVFVPDGHAETFAEMTSGQKNALSHRARAIEKFLVFIEAE